MAKKLNKNVVGLLTLAVMVFLGVGGVLAVNSLPGQDPTRYAEEAARLEKDGKHAQAKKIYQRAYRRDPAQDPKYLVSAAKCALAEGEVGEALGYLQGARLRDSHLKSGAELATEIRFEIARLYGSSANWADVRKE